MYNARFNHFSGYAIAKPQAVIVTAIDTAPLDYKPSRDISHLVKLYRDRGYPLGKSRKGLKKYLKRMLLKALGCKTYNQAMRNAKRNAVARHAKAAQRLRLAASYDRDGKDKYAFIVRNPKNGIKYQHTLQMSETVSNEPVLEFEEDDRANPCPNCLTGELEFVISTDETYDGRLVPEAEIIGSTCGCVLNHVQISIACERAEREAADFSFGED